MGAYAAIAIAVVSTVAGVASAQQQGRNQRKMANYQAQVAENNAKIAEQQADYALRKGEQDAVTQSMKGAAIAGRVRAAQAANAIDINTGSAVDVQESQREQSVLDTETVMHNSQMEAYGYRSQAQDFRGQSGMSRASGEMATQEARNRSFGSLLEGASAVAGSWGKLPKSSSPNTWSPDWGGIE